MRNKIKLKMIMAVCVVCMFFFGTALTVSAAGVITIAVSSGTVQTGDTVTVTVYAENSNGESVTADMNITYDATKLEYVSSSASNASGGGGTVKASGSDVDIKFKAIGSGDAYVKAEGATLTAAGAHINVSGTSEASSSDDNRTKSGDNSLSSLTLSNGTLSPAFKGSITEYTAEVGSDVSEITVTPVTSNSRATVESITGNKELKEGTNVITVLVKAENGTTASYKITVTKKDTPTAGSGNAGVSEIAGQAAEQTPEQTTGTESAAGSDAIVIDGVNYKISQDFTDEEIPEGFSKANFEFKGSPYQGIMFDKGYLGMYYLVSDTGEGKFFIYDANRDKFYPYVRLSSGEHFIILITVPNGVIPPDNYEETTLSIGEEVSVPAYRYTGGAQKEIVKTEGEESGAASIDSSDFYIFYGMDDTGITCWYQYDTVQGTYQRFNEEALSSEDVPQDYEELSKSYKELSDQKKETRVKNRRTMAVMIFVIVVLVIVIINLLIKLRDGGEDDDEKFEKERSVRRERPRKKAAKPVKSSRPDTPKKTYEDDDAAFYDDDDDDIIDEFEENPSVLGKKVSKRDKPVRMKKAEAKRPSAEKEERIIPDDDDDDDDGLEFFDLNDL